MFHILENRIRILPLEESRYSLVPSPKGRVQALPGTWIGNEARIFPAMLGVQWRRQRSGQAPGDRYQGREEREYSKQEGVGIRSETAVGGSSCREMQTPSAGPGIDSAINTFGLRNGGDRKK